MFSGRGASPRDMNLTVSFSLEAGDETELRKSTLNPKQTVIRWREWKQKAGMKRWSDSRKYVDLICLTHTHGWRHSWSGVEEWIWALISRTEADSERLAERWLSKWAFLDRLCEELQESCTRRYFPFVPSMKEHFSVSHYLKKHYVGNFLYRETFN